MVVGAVLGLVGIKSPRFAILAFVIVGGIGGTWVAWEHKWLKPFRRAIVLVVVTWGAIGTLGVIAWPPAETFKPSFLRNASNEELKELSNKAQGEIIGIRVAQDEEADRLAKDYTAKRGIRSPRKLMDDEHDSYLKKHEMFRNSVLPHACNVRDEALWRLRQPKEMIDTLFSRSCSGEDIDTSTNNLNKMAGDLRELTEQLH
jgi:hypothetical protein